MRRAGHPGKRRDGGRTRRSSWPISDLERTVAGVTTWALGNAGQACGAIEIAYVDEQIADIFVAALARAWQKLSVGRGRRADVGPLANQRQFDVVVSHVDDARAKGAVVVCGGAPTGEGLCFAPTLLDRCNARMKVVRDETFGPVLAIIRVAGAADAVTQANESRYGLGASIWTADSGSRRTARRAARLRRRYHQQPRLLGRDSGPALERHARHRPRPCKQCLLALDVRPPARHDRRPVDYTPDALLDALRRGLLLDLGDILADAFVGRFDRAWRLPLLMRKRIRTIRDFFR